MYYYQARGLKLSLNNQQFDVSQLREANTQLKKGEFVELTSKTEKGKLVKGVFQDGKDNIVFNLEGKTYVASSDSMDFSSIDFAGGNVSAELDGKTVELLFVEDDITSATEGFQKAMKGLGAYWKGDKGAATAVVVTGAALANPVVGLGLGAAAIGLSVGYAGHKVLDGLYNNSDDRLLMEATKPITLK